MSANANIISALIELSHQGELDETPDGIKVVFHDALLRQVSAALIGFDAMNLGYAEITLSLADDLDMFQDGAPWGPEEESAALGVFEASSTWLKIQKDCLTVEIWEENADDTLIGTESISNVPGLVEALARIRSEVAAEMANRLLK
jgi:hypothetical protein